MQTSKNHFEAKVIFNDETIRRMFRTEFYTYEGMQRLVWLAVAFALVMLALFVPIPTVVKVLCLLVGCAMFAMPDFLSRVAAEGVIMQRGGAESTVSCRINAGGVDVENGAHIPFDKIDRLVEDDQYFYLFQSRQMAVMIPKGSLLPANPERFAKVLAKETGKDWQQPKSLWGHNLAEDHAVHIQLTSFAEQVKEKTNGTVNIQIIPNGTLGSESDMISQIQAGALDMAKVSASTLGNFSEKYNAFSVPYVFDDQAHYYTYMDSDSAQAVFESTDDQGFRGLTWLDSGARSFYTKATAIRTPADLKGLKIRTMDSQMAIDMMNCLGGSATVMGYSDIYTGMQQGVIDGAENNVTALRDHGDVTKYYCFDEHTRIPDMVIISSNIWNQFSDDQKSAVTECAKAATEEYKTAWKNFEDEVLDKAVNQNGVELVKDVDIAAFQSAVQPIYENLKTANPTTYAVVEEIRAMV